jgi:hypothetical protein
VGEEESGRTMTDQRIPTIATAGGRAAGLLIYCNSRIREAKETLRLLRAHQVAGAMAPLVNLPASGAGIVGAIVFGLRARLADR